MSSDKRRKTSLSKKHPLFGTIVKKSFTIDLHQKSSSGVTLYRVVFKVIDKQTQEEQYCYAWQRFKNFQILSKKFEEIHKLRGDPSKLPQLISASYFDRFKPDVIEERKKSCVEILQAASSLHHLAKSDTLIEFLQGYKFFDPHSRNQSISEISVSSIDTLTMDAPIPIDNLSADDDNEVLATSNPWESKEPVLTSNTNFNSGDNLIQLSSSNEDHQESNTLLVVDSSQKSLDDSHLTIQSQTPASMCSSDDEDKSLTETYAKKLLSTSLEGTEWNTSVSLTPKGSDTEEDGAPHNHAQHPVTVSPIPDDSTVAVSSSSTKESSSVPSWWNSALQETDELAKLDDQNSLDSKDYATTKPLQLEGLNPQQPVESIIHHHPSIAEQFSLNAPLSPDVDTSSPEAYLLQSGQMIREALELERRGHYLQAFETLKSGVGLLLRGVQTDEDASRREAVRKKTGGYLRHAEKIYNQHLANKESSKPHYIGDFKVIGLLKKCMLVKSKHSGEKFIVKTLHKNLVTRRVGKTNKPAKNRSSFPCPFMVKLLHHYETTSSIYLLLEYVTGGTILDVLKAEKDRFERRKSGISTPLNLSLDPVDDSYINEDDKVMDEELLKELSFAPATSQPVDEQLLPPADEQVSEHSSDEEKSVTSLTELRDALEESGVDTSCLDEERPPPSPIPLTTIEPPTPTTPGADKVPPSVVDDFDKLVTTDSDKSDKEKSPPSEEKEPFRKYSPGSVRKKLEEFELTELDVHLEGFIRKWVGQVVVALEHLHSQGVVCRDLHPENILISENGNVKLTYFGNWDHVQPQADSRLADHLYLAPEICGVGKAIPLVDWWSLGVILYELLTGLSLTSCHPGGLSSHCDLEIPATVSVEARSLLTQLLQVNPKERLGSSMDGAGDIKSHPFFAGFDWSTAIQPINEND
ncbi:ribosomal protein S6 kinase-like 1 isoform X2 [Dysidea avara]|uniref:ribosomal protein S6 kinase-like 1 isoform X2 n=1 Tax=Dysidea avara TaxID=196820 RepID=UPI0033251379